jgi:hypothetical protein
VAVTDMAVIHMAERLERSRWTSGPGPDGATLVALAGRVSLCA